MGKIAVGLAKTPVGMGKVPVGVNKIPVGKDKTPAGRRRVPRGFSPPVPQKGKHKPMCGRFYLAIMPNIEKAFEEAFGIPFSPTPDPPMVGNRLPYQDPNIL